MTQKTLGIIGGSGLYELPGLENKEEVRVETPFGEPSDVIVTGTLHGVRCAFLPRHGRGHRILPSELPFRANICAMKQLGMDAILAVSAVGSLQKKIVPGHLVLIDQFLDRTRGRTEESTFFGDGCVGHVHFAEPIWEPLRQVALEAARDTDTTVHDGGTYVCMEGPAFSTRAESKLYHSWGMDVIGMTNLQEAKLAHEAELAYATVALATDYDSWNEEVGSVKIEDILKVIHDNVERAKKVVDGVAKRLGALAEPISAKGVAEHAILTDRALIPAETRKRLEPIFGDYLKGS
ncbi:MAG: S-methyl-5'-thioadenosine phosphorylase [Planctomycetota bacterium]